MTRWKHGLRRVTDLDNQRMILYFANCIIVFLRNQCLCRHSSLHIYVEKCGIKKLPWLPYRKQELFCAAHKTFTQLSSLWLNFPSQQILCKTKMCERLQPFLQTPTHLLPQVIEGDIIFYVISVISISCAPSWPCFSFNMLQWLPKFAVAVSTCLVVAQNSRSYWKYTFTCGCVLTQLSTSIVMSKMCK